MKFLCDNCKAKYQIADEKVAGKTVRMKCRKCGHQIEVRAAVTETSVANAPPKASSAGPSAPKAPQRSGLATSLSATKPRAPSPSNAPGALGAAFQRNVHEAPANAPTTGISTSQIELSVTDEWYVAINGVPVGPVRISELRRKAAAGAVTEDSLCWQEGLEEWRPIKSIPDLAALVREAAQGGARSSMISSPEAPAAAPPRAPSVPSAPRQRASVPPARPASAPSAPVGTAPLAAPLSMAPAPARSNVVPLRPAASAAMDDALLGGSLTVPNNNGGAAAALAPSIQPERAPSFAPPPPAPAPVADPFALPPAPIASPLAPPSIGPQPFAPAIMAPPAEPHREGGGKRGGVPLWFIPVLVLALGFGAGAAFFVFRPQPAPPPVVIQMPPAATTPATAANDRANDVPPPPTSADAPAAPDAKPTTAAAGKGGAVAAKGNTAKPEEKKGIDLGGLVPGSGGPSVGPGGGGAAGGGGLDQAGVERVVAAHRNGVKRTCWERGGDQKSSVNVTVTATVAPDGSVSSASSSGDDPVVAKCIENQVRSWRFSAPGSTTTINIPFKFVRQ